MPTLPKVALERTITDNMHQIMGIMKGIAMSSFVEVKKKRDARFERFTRSFDGFFQLADLSKVPSPFVQPESAKICVIAVTSNESFMAGLNNKILRQGILKTEGRDRHFLITGPRMMGRLKQEEIPFTMFPGFREKNIHDVASQIKDYVVKKVKEKEYGKVIAVFADPVSLSNQEIRAVTLLPAHDVYPQEMNEGLDPKEMICSESDINAIMEFLSEIWLTWRLVEMFQDNKMSEYAAQAMQLDGSLQNLQDLQKRLKLLYVKTRREVIDSSLRETVASMLVASAGKK